MGAASLLGIAVGAIVLLLILVMLATNNPTLKNFFLRLKPGKKTEKEAA